MSKIKTKTGKKPSKDLGPQKVPGTEIAMLSGLKTLLVPIGDVQPDPSNPRVVRDLGALRGSLSRFGLRRPIIVNERNKIIEAGHQTRQALMELGATHIPVIWADDDGLTATAFNIADNRTAEIVADWDDEALAKLLNELQVDGDLTGIGYTQQQVDGLISSFLDHGVGDDEDLPSTAFDDDEDVGVGMTKRVIIVYDNDEQKEILEERIGAKLEKILYHFRELIPMEG